MPDRAVCVVSLGCSKNLVDSEVMVGHLARAGVSLVTDASDSDVVIVNTCGFIEEAREESVDTILEYAELKRAGVVRGLVVTGCLVQLHEAQLAAELPEVDAFLPLSDYSGVPSIVDQVLGLPTEAGPCPSGTGAGAATTGAAATGVTADAAGRAAGSGPGQAAGQQVDLATRGGGPKGGSADLGRSLLTPRHTAYLRLGEGCNHVCAFCAIPKIRGKLQSKPLEVLLEEASALAQLGARELTLIAEDSTDYGKDLGLGYGLADLLEGLGKVDDLRWVRVMYAHPATIDERLIETMAAVPNVLPYIDMPVQHGDAEVLRRMRRGSSPERIRRVVGLLREAMPEITLRTTILVGFPGETDRRFGHLLDLLDELAFDRVGCFTFSPEEGTEGAGLGARPSRRAAEERRDEVMRRQRERLGASHRARVGGVETVLVDLVEPLAGVPGQHLAVARSRHDAPEVDGQVLVAVDPAAHPEIEPGIFVDVKMTGVKGYDMVGTIAT